MSKTRTCHFRAGGSCGKLTALPLSVDDAAPDGSGREDLRLYKLEHVRRTVVRPGVNPVLAEPPALPDDAFGSTQRQSTCTAKNRSGSSLTCAYTYRPVRPSAGLPIFGTRTKFAAGTLPVTSTTLRPSPRSTTVVTSPSRVALVIWSRPHSLNTLMKSGVSSTADAPRPGVPTAISVRCGLSQWETSKSGACRVLAGVTRGCCSFGATLVSPRAVRSRRAVWREEESDTVL